MKDEDFLEEYFDASCRFAQACEPAAECVPRADWEADLMTCEFNPDHFEKCLDEWEAAISAQDCEAPTAFPDIPTCDLAYDCGVD